MAQLLSVLVPLYNEEEYVATLLDRVLRAPLPEGVTSEAVVVDDASTDSSAAEVQAVADAWPGRVRLIRHAKNQGKAAAVRTALAEARGEFCVIQDADLEYNPAEYARLLKPILEQNADAVFGSRFLAAGERRVLYFWHALANRFVTTLANMVADLNLTDVETCYKCFRTSLVRSIPLRENRFAIEPELAIKLAKRQASIYEVPISYYGRTYNEGKKIGLRDAFEAVWVILKCGLLRDIYTDHGAQILDTLSATPRFNRWMADTIRPFAGKRILEIGAGIGNLTAQLSPGRTSYHATDYDEEHIARLRTRFHGRPRLTITRCDLTQSADFAPFRESVDTVVCLNVVEHIGDDLGGLRNIYSALEPGGRAIILVPQGQSIYGTLDEVLGHYRRYSEDQLRERMQQAGFDVRQILRFNRITRPGWWLNGRLLKKRTFGRFQLWVFDRLVWLWRILDRVLPWNPVSIIAIGDKKK